jgi:hypothetical protein
MGMPRCGGRRTCDCKPKNSVHSRKILAEIRDHDARRVIDVDLRVFIDLDHASQSTGNSGLGARPEGLSYWLMCKRLAKTLQLMGHFCTTFSYSRAPECVQYGRLSNVWHPDNEDVCSIA